MATEFLRFIIKRVIYFEFWLKEESASPVTYGMVQN